MSSVVHMDDSSQPLRPYKDELSAHPYFISHQDTSNRGPHFLGDNSTHLLTYTCLPTNGDDQCPFVITLLAEEDIDINIRVTEPYYCTHVQSTKHWNSLVGVYQLLMIHTHTVSPSLFDLVSIMLHGVHLLPSPSPPVCDISRIIVLTSGFFLSTPVHTYNT